MEMETKIKLVRRGGFTVLPTSLLRDPALTLQAKGLFAMMMAYPPEWEYSVKGLAADVGCGRDKIRAALKCLEDGGYLLREQQHGENGAFSGNLFILYDAPLPGFPATVSPLPGFPAPGNPTQVNKDLSNIYPPISPQGGTRKRRNATTNAPKDAPDWKPERFAGFWAYYPALRRKDKQKAIRAWDKLKPDDALISTIAQALKRLKASDDWKQGVGIPYPATFLNNRRWEDAAELGAADTGGAGEEVYGWATT